MSLDNDDFFGFAGALAQGVKHVDSLKTSPALMVADLVRAIERDSKPSCNEDDGRWTIEMIHGVYRAQNSGGRATFPLQVRGHALAM